MEKIYNDLKTHFILSAVSVFLILITFFQTCSVKNNLREQTNLFNDRVDSLTKVINSYQIENYKINVEYLKELQSLSTSLSLKNKDVMIERQNSLIQQLNKKIKASK